MSKKLTEMSLEELWQLFPIILTAHQECWEQWYLAEEALLKKVLPQAQRISHIGSSFLSVGKHQSLVRVFNFTFVGLFFFIINNCRTIDIIKVYSLYGRRIY